MDCQAALNSLNESCGTQFIKGIDLKRDRYYQILGAKTMKTKFGPRLTLTIVYDDNPKQVEEKLLCLPPRFNCAVKKEHMKKILKDGSTVSSIACTGVKIFNNVTTPIYSFKQDAKDNSRSTVSTVEADDEDDD